MDLPAIKIMEQYARQHPDVVSLSQGIPAVSSDARIRLFVIEALLRNKVDKYADPAGLIQLREALSKDLARQNMRYSTDEILVTTGAVSAMTASMLSICKPGDEIIIPTPTYAAFFRSAKLAGLVVKTVMLDEANNWYLSIEAIKRQVTKKTKAILLCHPNNPTGSTLSNQQFEELGSLLLEHNLYLLLDEVYRNMYYEEEPLSSLCTDSKYKDAIIRIVSFSKDFALSGWRVGFVHSSQTIIDKLIPVTDSMVNCAPVISQYAALGALNYSQEIIGENKIRYLEQRALMGSYLEELDEKISVMYPQGSYFFFPKIHNLQDSRSFCLDMVKKAQVAVVPGSDFGPGGEGHIRLCFGRAKGDIIEGMERFNRYVKEHV